MLRALILEFSRVTKLTTEGVLNIVRYVDDLLILTRTGEAQQAVDKELRASLKGGLALKHEKTELHPPKSKFKYLGFSLDVLTGKLALDTRSKKHLDICNIYESSTREVSKEIGRAFTVYAKNVSITPPSVSKVSVRATRSRGRPKRAKDLLISAILRSKDSGKLHNN